MNNCYVDQTSRRLRSFLNTVQWFSGVCYCVDFMLCFVPFQFHSSLVIDV